MLYICGHSDLSLLFAGQEIYENKEQFSAGRIVSLDGRVEENHMSWEKFMTAGDAIDDDTLIRAKESVTIRDIYSMQYTSGTESRPKAAMLSQFAAIHAADAYVQRFHISETDITCVPLPLFHCFGGVLTLLGTLISGSTTIYLRHFSKTETFLAIEKEHATTIMGVPTMFYSMIHTPNLGQYQLRSLIKAGIGGAVCPPELAWQIQKTFHINCLSVGYGLSESASMCTVADVFDSPEARLESSGYPAPGVEVLLRDLSTGRIDETVTEGEIVVRGDTVMEGYYNNPDATAKAIDAEGWLHTGDLGRWINGNLHVVDRLKNIVIKGGENISPSEVEEKLLTIPGICECQCVGVPDEKYGEELAAFVIFAKNKRIPSETLKELMKSRVAAYKVPRYVFEVKEFPLNGSGKVVKSKLIQMAVSHLRQKEEGIDI